MQKAFQNTRGYVFPLILLASISIGFFTITLIQLQSSHRDQLMHLNSYQHALNLAYSVNVEVLSELREKQWVNRFFKGKPVNRLNQKLFGGIYDLTVEDHDPAVYTFNVKIRTNIAGKTNLFYWRQKYIPNMLDFTRLTLPVFFGEFAPELFEPARKTELDKQVDEKIAEAAANKDKSIEIANKLKKEKTASEILKEIAALPPGKSADSLKDGNKPRPSPQQVNTRPSNQEKTSVNEVVSSLASVLDEVDTINLPATGKSILDANDLMLRDEPWGKVLGDIPAGASFQVIGIRGDFFEVTYNGKTGYAHMNFVSVPGHTPSGIDPPRPPGAPPPQ